MNNDCIPLPLPLPAQELDDAGLNRQHVFDLASLPSQLLAPLAVQPHEKQLLLFGHAGRRLWQQVQASGVGGEHPIDDHSRATVHRWFAAVAPRARYRIVFPEPRDSIGLAAPAVGLQALGQAAGWHHATPFKLGIDAVWGSWFAYRAVAITDPPFLPPPVVDNGHPCTTCTDRACIHVCPAGALSSGELDFPRCGQYRLLPNSPCAGRCPARIACPIGTEHRYDDAQMRHAAALSLRALPMYLKKNGA
jgi:epoxyqueuosine reductase